MSRGEIIKEIQNRTILWTAPFGGTDDISDEELLKELEAVKNMAVPLPIPSPSPDEFEKIWARIQEEKS